MNNLNEDDLVKIISTFYTTEEILEKGIDTIKSEVKEVLEHIGKAGVNAAIAGKKLGIILNNLQQEKNETSN